MFWRDTEERKGVVLKQEKREPETNHRARGRRAIAARRNGRRRVEGAWKKGSRWVPPTAMGTYLVQERAMPGRGWDEPAPHWHGQRRRAERCLSSQMSL